MKSGALLLGLAISILPLKQDALVSDHPGQVLHLPCHNAEYQPPFEVPQCEAEWKIFGNTVVLTW